MWISSLNQLRKYLNLPSADEARIVKFSIDSRSILPGDFYCALPGNKIDGENFVEEALKKGAVGALVSNQYPIKAKNIIPVENVLETLQMLAKDVFETHRPKHVIAITGSLGKTTAKDFLATLLESSFSVFKTPGNANSQVGLPLSILNHFFSQEIAILEMGMTAHGQIERLVSLAPPDIALLTKVSLVHAGNFVSLEDIQEAKSEIFFHPRTKIGIYPNELALEKKGTCSKFTFGLNDENADFSRLIGEVPFDAPHYLHNLLGALSVAYVLDIDKSRLAKQVALLALPEKRMQKIEKKGVLFIDDSYNAAPESVIAALKSLPKPDFGKKRIAVLGEMLDLGHFSESAHTAVGKEALSQVDHLICYGEAALMIAAVWREAGRPFAHFKTHAEIAKYLKSLANPGDVVLLKGSNSTKMWMILDNFS